MTSPASLARLFQPALGRTAIAKSFATASVVRGAAARPVLSRAHSTSSPSSSSPTSCSCGAGTHHHREGHSHIEAVNQTESLVLKPNEGNSGGSVSGSPSVPAPTLNTFLTGSPSPASSSLLNQIARRKYSSASALDSGEHFKREVTIEDLLAENRKWAKETTENLPGFFEALSKQQQPDFLWLGCSDSRVPANQIVGLLPGEVFVHRNIANCVNHTDLSCLSVIQYAVEVLKVKHIIVVGHYGCGGVVAAMGTTQYGLLDNWLRAIKDLYYIHQHQLEPIPDVNARADLLCELNVARSVENVCHTSIVQNAWRRGQKLSVHGWCYRVDDGLIRDLHLSTYNEEQIRGVYRMSGN